jgi:hypothetical protein
MEKQIDWCNGRCVCMRVCVWERETERGRMLGHKKGYKWKGKKYEVYFSHVSFFHSIYEWQMCPRPSVGLDMCSPIHIPMASLK